MAPGEPVATTRAGMISGDVSGKIDKIVAAWPSGLLRHDAAAYMYGSSSIITIGVAAA